MSDPPRQDDQGALSYDEFSWTDVPTGHGTAALSWQTLHMKHTRWVFQCLQSRMIRMLLGGQNPAVSGETAAEESGAPTELCLLILILTCAFFSFEHFTYTCTPHILYVLAMPSCWVRPILQFVSKVERHLKVKGFFVSKLTSSLYYFLFYILTTILQAFPERRRSNASCHWSRENSWEMIMVGSTFPELTSA